MGIAVENPIALDDSLNREEQKKHIPQMVNIIINAPKFNLIKVSVSKRPGNVFEANIIPNSVTKASIIKVDTIKNKACVSQIRNRVFGVDTINAIDPLSTLFAIKRLEIEIT